MERDLRKFKEERQGLINAYQQLNSQRDNVTKRIMELNGIIEYLEKKQGEDKVE